MSSEHYVNYISNNNNTRLVAKAILDYGAEGKRLRMAPQFFLQLIDVKARASERTPEDVKYEEHIHA